MISIQFNSYIIRLEQQVSLVISHLHAIHNYSRKRKEIYTKKRAKKQNIKNAEEYLHGYLFQSFFAKFKRLYAKSGYIV